MTVAEAHRQYQAALEERRLVRGLLEDDYSIDTDGKQAILDRLDGVVGTAYAVATGALAEHERNAYRDFLGTMTPGWEPLFASACRRTP